MNGVRWLIDGSSSVLGALKRSQRIRPPANGGVVKVNLGSALCVAPGWIHVDGSLNALVASWPKPAHRLLYRFSGSNQLHTFEDYHRLLRTHRFIHHNLEYGVPMTDASADFVFTSHFLEHLVKPHALHLVHEVFRVLKPGGLVRIVVPDLAYAMLLYSKGDKRRMLDDFLFADSLGSHYARHKYMYDFELLQEILERAGFHAVTRRRYQEGEMPDIERLDNRPDESLFVEARKPPAPSPERNATGSPPAPRAD